MQKKGWLDLEAIIQGPFLEAKRGWRGSIVESSSTEESSSTCKMGIKLDLIQMKDLCKGN